jgi:hypothetical protein
VARLEPRKLSAKRALEPVEIVGSVDAVDAARAGAVAVEAVRGHAADHVRVSDEVRAARVAEAGTTGVVVVGQEDREVTGEPLFG